MQENFSKRHGYNAKEKEIVVREDAPEGLRLYILEVMYEIGLSAKALRTIVCRVLKVAPDEAGNWSDPNIRNEVRGHLTECEWFHVYDVIEAFYRKLTSSHEMTRYQEEINEYFRRNGIGWKLQDGKVQVRGDETFEKSLTTATKVLESAKLHTANTEIKEALADLSRRPTPDLTGAIQHSLACLECVVREVAGNDNLTLVDLVKKYPGVIPSPLDQAVTKIWGYTSEQGRHLKEGQVLEYLETELVVEVTAAISTYLGKRLGGKVSQQSQQTNNSDLPF